MKLLFIHEVNYKSKVIFEMHEFPELLALKGHQIDFLHFPENVGLRKSRFTSKIEAISGRAYQDADLRLITPPNFGGNFIDRLISTLYIIPVLFRLISRNKYDAIILYSVPTSGWQTALIAKFKRVPVIYRALDVSHLLRSGLTRSLVKTAEKIVYRNVDYISANNAALGKYCEKISSRPTNIGVNFPPLDLFHFQNVKGTTDLREKYGIKSDDFVMLFLGTFYEFSGIEKVLRSFSSNYLPRIKILLVGGGIHEPSIKQTVSRLKIEDSVILTGFVEYKDIPEFFAVSNVAFNSFESQLVSEVAFPHKVLQYLSAGIPTISTRLAGLYSALGNEAGVIWVNKPGEIYDATLKLMNSSPSELAGLAEKGKTFVRNQFAKEKSLNSFEEMIKKVIEKSS